LADGELAWTSFQKALRIITYSRAKAKEDGKEHPTQKAKEVMMWCIKYADRNAPEPILTVFDPFLGSGTTAVACKMLKRNYIGCEISPEYCKIAEDRIKSISNPLF